jgi:hypothetical protein
LFIVVFETTEPLAAHDSFLLALERSFLLLREELKLFLFDRSPFHFLQNISIKNLIKIVDHTVDAVVFTTSEILVNLILERVSTYDFWKHFLVVGASNHRGIRGIS